MKSNVNKHYNIPPPIHSGKCLEKEHYKLHRCKNCDKSKICSIKKVIFDTNIIANKFLEQGNQILLDEFIDFSHGNLNSFITIEIAGEILKKYLGELAKIDDNEGESQLNCGFTSICNNYLKFCQIIVNDEENIQNIISKLKEEGCEMGERDGKIIINALLANINYFITEDRNISGDNQTINKIAKKEGLKGITIILFNKKELKKEFPEFNP